MPGGRSFKKMTREMKEETIANTKPCRKKNGCLFKKKLSALNFFPGYSRNAICSKTQGDSGAVPSTTTDFNFRHMSSIHTISAFPRPQERKLLFDDKKRGLQRKESKKLKAPKEELCSLGKPHSGKMCPKCEIIVCRVCNTLHTESSFIAHSLLDHYDKGRHSCCSDSEFPQDHQVCKSSLGPAWLMSDLIAPAH